MSKRITVIVEGETDRRSLRHLLANLTKEDIVVVDWRVANKRLDVETARKLIVSAWYTPPENITPDKFVVLADADGRDPQEVLRPFQEQLPRRVGTKVTATLQFACAQWQLEAWFFADSTGLRQYLGRDLGSVDTSQPDSIPRPKLHLANLLGDRAYTHIIAEEIAMHLTPEMIAQRSPSFQGFVDAVRNGRLVPQVQVPQ